MPFSHLRLSAPILKALDEQNYSRPTPIQEQSIIPVLQGRDVMAKAQTGTGKTAAFVLPILERLSNEPLAKGRRPIRALILTPTRELAMQVCENAQAYCRYLPLRARAFFGGVKIAGQIRAMEQGFDILIATPGRLLDHLQQKTVNLRQVQTFVLDEADRMLDMGFIHDIKRIQQYLPQSRQNLLFSATYSREIKKLADGLLENPTRVEVSKNNSAAQTVKHLVWPVDKSRKREMLSHMIGEKNWPQVLVFTRTKHGANRLAKQLEIDGLRAAAIHGNKSQGARTRALSDFKERRLQVLVATDIAARGLDIEQLPYVVNYDLPNVPEDYIHRIGRTGRAGLEGLAVSLVCADEADLLHDIEKCLQHKIERFEIPGYEVTQTLRIESKNKVRAGQGTEQGQDQKKKRSGLKPKHERGMSGRPNRSFRSAKSRHATPKARSGA